MLYGIDMAKSAIVKKRQAVIVEGYTDVMAMHLAGIDTAIATCGTAFGAEHAKIVRRLIADDSLGAVQLVGPLKVEGQALSSRIVFTFDGDAAGQKAAIHAFGLDSAFSTQAFVAVADDNLDPCDLRIKRGNEAVRALIDHAEPLYDFVIKTAIGRFDTTYTTGQMGAVKAVAPLIAQIRDRSLLDLYSRKAVRQIGVDLDIMQREVRDARRKLQVRDEDAYAPKRRFAGNAGAAVEPRMEQGTNPYANPSARKALEHRDAAEQSYYRIDDAVFICEQQFMATLIQVPLAVDPTLFASLTLSSFMTPVFRTLFQAVAAAGDCRLLIPRKDCGCTISPKRVVRCWNPSSTSLPSCHCRFLRAILTQNVRRNNRRKATCNCASRPTTNADTRLNSSFDCLTRASCAKSARTSVAWRNCRTVPRKSSCLARLPSWKRCARICRRGCSAITSPEYLVCRSVNPERLCRSPEFATCLSAV